MHSPRRLVRLGLPAVAVLVAGLAGCGEPAPAPGPAAAATSPAPAATPAATDLGTVAGTAGSDGLTVRYLGDDGSLRSVRVEDFPSGR